MRIVILLLFCQPLLAQQVLVDTISLEQFIERKMPSMSESTNFEINTVTGDYTLKKSDAIDNVIVVADGASITADASGFNDGAVVRIVTLTENKSQILLPGKKLVLRYYPSGVTLIKDGEFKILSFNGHIKGL